MLSSMFRWVVELERCHLSTWVDYFDIDSNSTRNIVFRNKIESAIEEN